MLHMPTVLHLPLTLLGGIVGGMLCGAVPGLLRPTPGAHEVIVTLMFNYVTYAFLLYAVLSTPFQQPGQQNDIGRTMDRSAILAPLFGTKSGLARQLRRSSSPRPSCSLRGGCSTAPHSASTFASPAPTPRPRGRRASAPVRSS